MDADLLVVGGGVMGLGTAWAAAKQGASVVLVDPQPTLNERNASNDVSKVFRFAYGRERSYVPLAKQALAGWRALEAETGARVLHPGGLLLFGPRGGFADQSARTLLEMGEPVEVLEGARLGERFPAFAGLDHAVLDPSGGWLDPRVALPALERAAVAHGARVRRGVSAQRVRDGEVLLSDGMLLRGRACVVAAGFDAPRLLPHLRPLLRVTRQVELLFRPAAPVELPVFAAMEEGFYGFPMQDGLVKVADHRKGPGVADFERRPPATPQEEATARAWLAQRIPALAAAPLAGSRVCLYDNTADDRFLIGPAPGMPRVVVAAGFSGHGFKFGPAVGEHLARMALEAGRAGARSGS